MTRRSWLGAVGSMAAAVGSYGAIAGRAEASTRLPAGMAPDIACWFLRPGELEPLAWREFIDVVANHSPFTLLTTSIRAPGIEVTDPAVREALGRAVEYAQSRGIGIVQDLDVRLAREAFETAYPDQLQQMLRIRELPDGESDVLRFAPEALSDHYTGLAPPYLCRGGRFVRALSYRVEGEAILPDTIEDVTARCEVLEESEEAVVVRLPRHPGTRTCAIVTFSHFAADAFSPEIIPFQSEIIRSYRDVPLVGVCKDEWGFPPCFDGTPNHDDIWYSEAMDQEYERRTGTRLLDAAPLLWRPHVGREAERAGAINAFNRMVLDRHVEIESAFYDVTKEVFGPDAFVGTHATWFPQPDVRELKKNGLDWWRAPRDYAQSDEITPYGCRTSMAKKWGGPWYNMFYAPTIEPYLLEVVAAARAGGRVNYHPPYPREDYVNARTEIFSAPLLDAHCLHRLLGFVTSAPMACPVAVIFGHEAAANWSEPTWGDTGQALVEEWWLRGIGADQIPSTEVESGHLFVDDEGKVRYGPQQYERVYLYHPEFCGPGVRRFIEKAEAAGGSEVIQVGGWTRGPDGASLPAEEVRRGVSEVQIGEGDPVSVCGVGSAERVSVWGGTVVVPSPGAPSRFLDGTLVFTGPGAMWCASDGASGAGAEADKFAAFRVGASGQVEALCGRIRRAKWPNLQLHFREAVDLALWRDESGWHGVVQDFEGPLPLALLELTEDWLWLRTPPPYSS